MSIELPVVKWLRKINNASTNVLHGGLEVRKKSSSFYQTAELERWRLLNKSSKDNDNYEWKYGAGDGRVEISWDDIHGNFAEGVDWWSLTLDVNEWRFCFCVVRSFGVQINGT